jgi:DMSO/TMAO reductase YedYZ heme-binding membrane subunit
MKKVFIVLGFIALLLLPPAIRMIRSPFLDIRTIIRLAGLVGFTLMSFQFILSARLPFIERTFGQDKLMVAHRTAGISSLIVLFAHGPLYLIDRISLEGGLFLQLPQELPIVSGSLGFTLLLFLGIGAAFRAALRIPYDLWKTMHKLTYFLYPMLFIHAMLLGGTIRSSIVVYIQFLLMFALVLVSWVWRLSLGIRARRQPYMLSAVKKPESQRPRVLLRRPGNEPSAGTVRFSDPGERRKTAARPSVHHQLISPPERSDIYHQGIRGFHRGNTLIASGNRGLYRGALRPIFVHEYTRQGIVAVYSRRGRHNADAQHAQDSTDR